MLTIAGDWVVAEGDQDPGLVAGGGAGQGAGAVTVTPGPDLGLIPGVDPDHVPGGGILEAPVPKEVELDLTPGHIQGMVVQ